MLVGEPGTAKSLLSELLAAAVSGDSTLTIQGGAATTEDQIKYSWNYALLVAEGPSTRSLVPAPLLRGMAEGKIVRFEEITRCPLEVQDSLLSLLSDRVLAVPELTGPDGMVFAARRVQRHRHRQHPRPRRQRDERGAQAAVQLRDGVPDRRLRHRAGPGRGRGGRAAARAPACAVAPRRDVLEVLVTTFRELRTGRPAAATRWTG